MFVPLRIRNIMEKWAILPKHVDLQTRIYIQLNVWTKCKIWYALFSQKVIDYHGAK